MHQAEFLFISLLTPWLSRNCLCNHISGHHWVLTLKMDMLNSSFWGFGIAVAEGNSCGQFGEWILVTFLSKNIFGCSDVFLLAHGLRERDLESQIYLK